MGDTRESEKQGQGKVDDQGTRDDSRTDSERITDPEPFPVTMVGEMDVDEVNREPSSEKQT